MDDAALERRLAEFLDEGASAAAQQELLRELESNPALRTQLYEQQQLDRLLAAEAAPALDPRIILRAIPNGGPVLSRRVMRRIGPRSHWGLPGRRPFLTLAAAAALTLSVLTALLFLRESSPEGPAFAEIKMLEGEGVVVRGQLRLPLRTALPLFANDVIELTESGRATLTYAGGAVLELGNASQLNVSSAANRARPRLSRGVLQARVAKRDPAHPLVIDTPLASAEVIGTAFKLSASVEAVALHVREGVVRFTALQSAESRDVHAGEKGEVFVGGVLHWTYDAPRDPLLWPFAARSPWNHPIGSGARYTAASTPTFALTRGAKANIHLYSHPVFIAGPDDPERELFLRGGRKLFSLRVPLAARADPSEKGTLTVLNRSAWSAIEMTQLEQQADGSIRAVDAAVVDLTGSGFGTESVRISGASCLGGLIRKGEFQSGIRHALALSVIRKALVRTYTFIWPATKSHTAFGVGTEGVCQLGSLLAIPPEVDVRTLGVGDAGPAYEVARALQDYGGYIVESFGAGSNDIDFFVEPAAAGEVPPGFDQALSKLTPHLKVIINNSAQNTGGGGKPRRPFAPELKAREKQADF